MAGLFLVRGSGSLTVQRVRHEIQVKPLSPFELRTNEPRLLVESHGVWRTIKHFGGSCLPKQLSRNRRGNVAVTLAVGLSVVVGAVGLGTDAANWYSTRRTMQNAADLGAEGAGNALKVNLPGSSTGDTTAIKEAKSATAAHGFANGGDVTVTVNIPPLSGSHTGSSYNHLAAEVIISQPSPGFFSSIFLNSGPTITTRAVSMINYSKSDRRMKTQS